MAVTYERLRAVDASDTLKEGAVLSKAVARAADFLDLSNKVVARTLGLSEATEIGRAHV